MRIAKRPAELGFTRYDVPRLKKALKRVPDKRLFQRVQAALWVAQGHAISEVAALTNVRVQTVYNWIKLYLECHHVAALADAPRSGRPLAAPRITAARILYHL
jgi:helix-turn-helix protein